MFNFTSVLFFSLEDIHILKFFEFFFLKSYCDMKICICRDTCNSSRWVIDASFVFGTRQDESWTHHLCLGLVNMSPGLIHLCLGLVKMSPGLLICVSDLPFSAKRNKKCISETPDFSVGTRQRFIQQGSLYLYCDLF